MKIEVGSTKEVPQQLDEPIPTEKGIAIEQVGSHDESKGGYLAAG